MVLMYLGIAVLHVRHRAHVLLSWRLTEHVQQTTGQFRPLDTCSPVLTPHSTCSTNNRSVQSFEHMFSCPDASLNMFNKQQVSSDLWTHVLLSWRLTQHVQQATGQFRPLNTCSPVLTPHSTCSTSNRWVQTFGHMFSCPDASLNMFKKQQVNSVLWTHVFSSQSYHLTCSTNSRSVQSFEQMFPALTVINEHVQQTTGQSIPLKHVSSSHSYHWTCSTNNRSVQSFEHMFPALTVINKHVQQTTGQFSPMNTCFQLSQLLMNMLNKQQVSSVLWTHVSSTQSYHWTCSTTTGLFNPLNTCFQLSELSLNIHVQHTTGLFIPLNTCFQLRVSTKHIQQTTGLFSPLNTCFQLSELSLNMFNKQQVSWVLWTHVFSSELSLNNENVQQTTGQFSPADTC
jgi:hypothetical protein